MQWEACQQHVHTSSLAQRVKEERGHHDCEGEMRQWTTVMYGKHCGVVCEVFEPSDTTKLRPEPISG